MPITSKDLLDAANAAVPRITPAEAQALIAAGDTLVVDVRDPGEVASTGKVAGAINVPRGMIEFRADPATPYFDAHFNPSRTLIVYCASGGRSALAGKTLKDMGYDKVFNLGAFKDWKEAGGIVDD